MRTLRRSIARAQAERAHRSPARFRHLAERRGRRYAANAVLRRDPTRTTRLRREFIRQVDRRLDEVLRLIREAIVDRDVFGIQIAATVTALQRGYTTPNPRAFAFPTSAQKVQAFMAWLRGQEAIGILDVFAMPGVAGIFPEWNDVAILSTYHRDVLETTYRNALEKAGAELEKSGYYLRPEAGVSTTTEAGLRAAFSSPFHVDRVGMIYARTYEDLKTVLEAGNAQVRRALSEGLTEGLAQGIAEGRSPRRIAQILAKDVTSGLDKVARPRLRMIARTEVVRAHHVATVAEFERIGEQLGEEIDVEVLAEWVTAGVNVCPECELLELGGPYKLAEVRGMIPVHPNCRCAILPIIRERRRQRGRRQRPSTRRFAGTTRERLASPEEVFA